MLNFPPDISLTRFPRCSAPPNSVSRLFGQLQAIRQLMVGCDCAMAGAATTPAAAPTAAFFRNALRFMLLPLLTWKAGILVLIQSCAARGKVQERRPHV